MNHNGPFGRTEDMVIGKKLMLSICNSVPKLPDFGLGINEPIDYELANHLKPSGKGKIISDPRNNDWRNSKRKGR